VSGGRGGVGGQGGHGGDGTVVGDDGVIIGGDGGDFASIDGRGGCAVRGLTERYSIDLSIWGYGRGGDAPEYARRIQLLVQIRAQYVERFPDDAPYIAAGIDVVPADWVNSVQTSWANCGM
jgi:hypothetical protein